MNKPEVVTIIREKWTAAVYHDAITDRRCALGWLAFEANGSVQGAVISTLIDLGYLTPDNVFAPYRHSTWAADVIGINDRNDISWETKESALRELFAAEGIQLRFVGEYAPAPPAVVMEIDEVLEYTSVKG